MIILLILSIIDIFAAVLLSGFMPFSYVLVSLFGFIILGKGLWTLFSALSVGNYLEWMGAIDFVGGLSLILVSSNIFVFIQFFWVVLLLKGLYSLFLSLKGL
jgi:hypothetical protein